MGTSRATAVTSRVFALLFALTLALGIAAATHPVVALADDLAAGTLTAQADATVITKADITLSYGTSSAKGSDTTPLTLVYSSQDLKPTVKIQKGTSVLVEGEHYNVTYPDDVKSAGEKTIAIELVSNSFKTEDGNPISLTYKIDKLDLTKTSTVSPSYAPATTSLMYTGSPIKPTVTLKANGSALPTSLYDVIYPEECTNVGQYSIKFKPKLKSDDSEDPNIVYKNSEGNPLERTWSYSITKLDLSSNYYCYLESYKIGTAAAVTATSIPSQTYTGSDIKPVITLKNYSTSGMTISSNLYNVSYSSDCKNVGTVTLTITPKKNADGTENSNITYGDNIKKTITFNITQAQMSSDSVTCSAISDKTYTGKAIKPSVSNVKFGSLKLVEGKDYEVSYDTNTSAGTGHVYLTGKGNFNTSSYYRKTLSFKIKPKSIGSGDISVSSIGAQEYTGAAYTPAITVTDRTAGKTLTQMTSEYISLYTGYGINYGNDYYVEYSNNTNPGTATAKVVGVGNYTGTRTVNFTIKGTGTAPKVKGVNKGNGTVKLTWGLIYGAQRYMILEKMPSGSYKTLSKDWTSTRCTISNLSTTRAHKFLVRAYVNGKWSSNSDKNLVSVKPTGAKKPTVHAVSKSNSAVTLTWNSVPGADRYGLYEKVGKKFTPLTTSYKATSVTINSLSKKASYTFYVRARVDGKWSKVKKADYVTISPMDPNPPVLKAVAGVGKGKVKLSWNKSRNAKKYKVEVKLANGKWKTLANNYKKKSYTAKGLDSSRTHTFRVRAYGNKKWSKAYSEYYASARPDNA